MKKILSVILIFTMLFCVTSSAELLSDNGYEVDGRITDGYLTNSENYMAWSTQIEAQAATTAAGALDPNCSAAILIEKETGKVLFEKNADEKLPIASVTKIMTLLLVMESIDKGIIKLEDLVTVSEYAASMGGSQAWMEPGEQLSVHEMLKAVVVSSCNDGAVALAEHIAGSEGAFVALMNEKAAELGMTSTNFINVTGLDDNDVHYSSARDVAIMSRQLISHPLIFDYTKIWMDTIRGGAFGLSNTNKLIRFYPGATGLKTGSTSKAKYCLSATAERSGMHLVAVVLAAPTSADRFSAAKSMLDYGFSNWAVYTPNIEKPSPVKVWGGMSDYVNCTFENPSMLVAKGQETRITARVEICEDISAPVDKYQKLGSIIYEIDGKTIGETPILADEDVEKMSYFDIVKRLLAGFFYNK